MLQDFFPIYSVLCVCIHPAPYDQAKVTFVCVYSDLRFLKKIKAIDVRMAVTMLNFLCAWPYTRAQKIKGNRRAHGYVHEQAHYWQRCPLGWVFTTKTPQ